MTLTKEDALQALKNVFDPELGIDVWTLGLIYGLKLDDEDTIEVEMTLTTPMCPYGPMLIAEVRQKLILKGFTVRDIHLTFNPPWEPSEEVRMMLGLA